MAYGLHRYKRTNIETADRRKIIVLLYEGAIRFLQNAARCIREEKRDLQGPLINKTLEIIRFLDNSLDFEQGGEIALKLESLYIYMRDTLTMANVENDADKVDEVVELFGTLLEGWRGIIEAPVEENQDAATEQTGESTEQASILEPSDTLPEALPTPAPQLPPSILNHPAAKAYLSPHHAKKRSGPPQSNSKMSA